VTKLSQKENEFECNKERFFCNFRLLTESRRRESFNMKTASSIPLKCQCVNGVKVIITTVPTTDEVEHVLCGNDS
jgi:3-hydroxyisobutyrate dehydrogenase-like beta-hydroxyacid dehydrogenase